jgi:hypothetical protein
MTPDEIRAFARGYHVGVAAGQRRVSSALLAEAEALAAEFAALRFEVARLEASFALADAHAGERVLH